MNDNKICNPKTEVPKGLELNDKDYVESILTVCKDLEKNLVIAMSEASHESLYETIYEMFNEIANLQREIYELWFRKGWFTLEKVENQKIINKYNTLNQEVVDLKNELFRKFFSFVNIILQLYRRFNVDYINLCV